MTLGDGLADHGFVATLHPALELGLVDTQYRSRVAKALPPGLPRLLGFAPHLVDLRARSCVSSSCKTVAVLMYRRWSSISAFSNCSSLRKRSRRSAGARTHTVWPLDSITPRINE